MAAISHGKYPMVMSSHGLVAGSSSGNGFPPRSPCRPRHEVGTDAKTWCCSPGISRPRRGTSARAGLQYELVEIGPLEPGQNLCAQAVNNRGPVVGTSDFFGGARAFLFEDGALLNLGVLAGNFSSAEDINERGQIVGLTTTPEGTVEAVVIEKGVFQTLGQLVPGGAFSGATAINNRGQIVGTARSTPGGGDGPVRAFLWDKGVMINLGTLDGDSFARDINERGDVVGLFVDTAQNTGFGFLWSKGVMTPSARWAATSATRSPSTLVGRSWAPRPTRRAFFGRSCSTMAA